RSARSGEDDRDHASPRSDTGSTSAEVVGIATCKSEQSRRLQAKRNLYGPGDHTAGSGLVQIAKAHIDRR
ncbi:MAG: hypothetical protein WBD45_12440, partial [Terriglobales bacterium]